MPAFARSGGQTHEKDLSVMADYEALASGDHKF